MSYWKQFCAYYCILQRPWGLTVHVDKMDKKTTFYQDDTLADNIAFVAYVHVY